MAEMIPLQRCPLSFSMELELHKPSMALTLRPYHKSSLDRPTYLLDEFLHIFQHLLGLLHRCEVASLDE